MQTYTNLDIQEIPLSSPFFHAKVERFLAANGLRLEEVDLYLALTSQEGDILAGAGLKGDVLKCIAVSADAREAGLTAPLLSRLIREASLRGIHNLKLFTKPENEAVFASFGFRLLAQAPLAILMENGGGLEAYCACLRAQRVRGTAGVVVMNANPLTLGHVYLVEQALRQVDHLFVIPVREDVSRFSYTERLTMLQTAFASQPRVTVLEGSAYQISSATFPTYFMKNFSDASVTQMQLDLDLFARHIAPALQVGMRFVGSEPSDPLTARYNDLMAEKLPGQGVRVTVIPRLARADVFVSASSVRNALDRGSFREASLLTPAVTHPYLLADLAGRALTLELETPLKPGLVCPDAVGAHADMDFALMRKAIAALRPFWSRMVTADWPETLRQLGLEAEKAMMEATGGVNTHRGAIFALGLALFAAGRILQMRENEGVMQSCLGENAQTGIDKHLLMSEIQKTALSLDSQAVCRREGVKSAREMAEGGYAELFQDWLPYLSSLKVQGVSDASAFSFASETPCTFTAKEKPGRLQRVLLRIMSTLDDTCVIKRVGKERAQEVKREAAQMLQCESQERDGWNDRLQEMCDRYAREGISPGGAADMLSLTVFVDSITQ